VFGSGRQAPHIPDPDVPCHQFADAEFIAALEARYGVRNEALHVPELVEVMLPTLRADCEVCETYAMTPGEPLSCPVTAIGASDDRMVTTDDLDAWRRHTTGPFDQVVVEGDHFFLDRDPTPLLDVIAARLAGCAG